MQALSTQDAVWLGVSEVVISSSPAEGVKRGMPATMGYDTCSSSQIRLSLAESYLLKHAPAVQQFGKEGPAYSHYDHAPQRIGQDAAALTDCAHLNCDFDKGQTRN